MNCWIQKLCNHFPPHAFFSYGNFLWQINLSPFKICWSQKCPKWDILQLLRLSFPSSKKFFILFTPLPSPFSDKSSVNEKFKRDCFQAKTGLRWEWSYLSKKAKIGIKSFLMLQQKLRKRRAKLLSCCQLKRESVAVTSKCQHVKKGPRCV